MITIDEYLTRPRHERDNARAQARSRAVQAHEYYADLLAAEAGIAARTAFPDTARLFSELTEDITGSSASLVAAYTATGQRLWHTDSDDEWLDQSEVTDNLAAAWDWYHGDYFPTACHDADLYEYELPADRPRTDTHD
jgi:hypothetical protein